MHSSLQSMALLTPHTLACMSPHVNFGGLSVKVQWHSFKILFDPSTIDSSCVQDIK
jgi:hypothetical protein